MITFVRSMAFSPGKNAEVMSFTRQAKKLLKERYSIELHAHIPIGGLPTRVAYSATFNNLTELEDAMTKLLADEDYLRLLAAFFPHIVAGSMRDELWREV
jgi:hypothetical protein